MMNRLKYPRRSFLRFVWLLGTTLFVFQNFAFSQTAPNLEPSRREQLLNGFKILFFNEPKSELVTLKMRINAGSAFDPQGKEGLMRLSANLLFDDGVKTLFTEDYGGSLNVTSNYDYIQIDASGRNENLLSMLDLLQTAVMNFPPPLERIKEEREKLLAEVAERRKNPAIVADEAVAKRLFGNFPYGRSEFGSPESLARIDRPDLLLVREKFFTADNSLLAITGNVQTGQTIRALRQFFGAWQKSDKLVPATFRQPDAPDTKQLEIEMPGLDKSYSSYAVNSGGRNDKDYFATEIFARMLQKVYCNEQYQYKAHLLRGVLKVTSIQGDNMEKSCPKPVLDKDEKPLHRAFTQNEFDTLKKDFIELFQKKSLADLWFDVETYKLVSVKNEFQKLNNVTLADMQRVSERLQKESSAKVAVFTSPKGETTKISTNKN